MRIAVITGASSGLGREYARMAAKDNYDEIWLVARRSERLKALASKLPVKTRILAYDLSGRADILAYRTLLRTKKPVIGLLICCAGLGKIGPVSAMSLDDTDAMINVNCRAAADMTAVSLPYMRKGSRIMEICSVAAYQPLQQLGVYAASKAFLYSYSKALAWEVRSRGITVTAVCPYWIKDTEFISAASEHNKKGVRHFPLAQSVSDVARRSYSDAKRGLVVSAPGRVSKIYRAAAKLIPHGVMMAGWDVLRRL